MAEKKTTTKKAAEVKETAAKKTTATKKTAAAKAVLVVNAENIGFKAGDVYQALAAAEKARLLRFLRKRLCSVSAGCLRRVNSRAQRTTRLFWPKTTQKKHKKGSVSIVYRPFFISMVNEACTNSRYYGF